MNVIFVALQEDDDAEVVPKARGPPVPARPLAGKAPSTAVTPSARQQPLNFTTIDRLAREISHESTVQDDENDPTVDNDDALLVNQLASSPICRHVNKRSGSRSHGNTVWNGHLFCDL